MCHTNGIFNITEAKEIGTFVISSRAATYGADETWAGKILGNMKEEGTPDENGTLGGLHESVGPGE